MRLLRDAAGRKRLGESGSRFLLDALHTAGYETDTTDLRFESQMVTVVRAGAFRLIETVAQLLPAIREADAMVPDLALRRDHVVARTAIRAWPGKRAEDE